MWNIKIIQVDNRESNVYVQSKDLVAGRQHMNTYSDSWHDIDRAAMKQEDICNPWKFWDFSRTINAIQAKRMQSKLNGLFNISYEWIAVDKDFMKNEDRDMIWLKVKFLKEYIKLFDSKDIIIFIDSDAFIRDRVELINLVSTFIESDKLLYTSLDVPRPRNSKINDGFMMIKCSNLMKKYFNDLWEKVDLAPEMRWSFPHMQKIADMLLETDEYKNCIMYASRTTETNTPIGEIVRHVWYREMIPELMIDQAFCLLAEEI